MPPFVGPLGRVRGRPARSCYLAAISMVPSHGPKPHEILFRGLAPCRARGISFVRSMIDLPESLCATRALRLLVGTAFALAVTAAAAGDAPRWVLLFAAIPPPPARAADAGAQIGVRAAAGDGLALEVIDPALRRLQRDIDALHAPVAAASAATVGEQLRAVNSDPELARLGREIDRVLKLDTANAPPPSAGEIRALEREVTRTLTERPKGSDTVASRAAVATPSAIFAYRSERQKSESSGASFYKRLFEAQSRYGSLHAMSDRDALARVATAGGGNGAGAARVAIARDLVKTHHALAQQQLAEATALFVEARTALCPVVEHMAGLARDAEANGASAVERAAAYGFLKSHAELLLTMDRVALEDAGFWSGVRARTGIGPRDPLYEFAPAPNTDLRVGTDAPVPGAPYPPGRARNNGPPGIR